MVQPVMARSNVVVGSTPVFCGARVPVRTLLDYLEAGGTINEFLEGFPSVRCEQVVAFLEEMTGTLDQFDARTPLTCSSNIGAASVAVVRRMSRSISA